MLEETKTDAAVVHELSRLAETGLPVGITTLEDGRTFAVHRKDFELTQITAAHRAEVLLPKRTNQIVTMQTAASLIDYVNRFKNLDSVIFADQGKGHIEAIIDYHKAPEAGGLADPKATLTSHRALYPLPFSKEWETWTGVNEKLMSHMAFASFLEENCFDVIHPAGADLLELCRDLQVKQNVNFSSSVRHGDYAKVSYSKEGDATTKDDIALPLKFTIAIPVYFGEPQVSIECMVRRQIDDGKLRLGFKMLRLEQIRQHEFARIAGTIQSETGLTTLYGIAR